VGEWADFLQELRVRNSPVERAEQMPPAVAADITAVVVAVARPQVLIKVAAAAGHRMSLERELRMAPPRPVQEQLPGTPAIRIEALQLPEVQWRLSDLMDL
jgi:hypothetical protein